MFITHMDIPKLIVEKLTQYNFLTNILPGTVLCIMLKYIAKIDLIIEPNWYLSGILFYFVGIVNNRFSSVVIEPILKKCKVIKHVKYAEYIRAEAKDEKLTTLSNENNVFRAYISVVLLSIFGFIYNKWLSSFQFTSNYGILIILILILVLFVFSYRKQTKYVVNRVKTNNKG